MINLGGDRPIRLSRIIDQIGQLLGRDPVIEYNPAHPADVPATWSNIDEEGLRRTVQWYLENRQTVLPLELGDR